METTNIVLCGLGGQGILFMTKILGQAALHKGFDIMGAETHGMAQRGGSVVSHLRLGPVRGSLVRNGAAHLLLGLEESEGYRNLPFLAPGGRMYVNAPSQEGPRAEVRNYQEDMGIVYRALPAARIAMDMASPLSTNLALTGFFSAFESSPFSYEELRATVEDISPDRFLQTNLQVFDAGYERGREESSR
jgi:indolepyruvate ferredoxin oxidoreductase beta subunit